MKIGGKACILVFRIGDKLRSKSQIDSFFARVLDLGILDNIMCREEASPAHQNMASKFEDILKPENL